MAICPSDYCDKKLRQLHSMSMVPLPCQECQLKCNGCTSSEEIKWVENYKCNVPIWSRLTTFNTMGFNRKLPMAMTKAYDVEIKGRLWSLWGKLRRKSLPKCDFVTHHKPFLAASVMGLCAARVFRLNIWTPQLLDSIISCAKVYTKKSLEDFVPTKLGFQLEHLATECSLEGINFDICIKTCQEGRMYGAPFQGNQNLAFGLVNFLSENQFGIVECFNRYVSFGFIKGREGGYFMFDAQSMNYPLFPKGYWAPYLLRTNHLQVLLYCIVVTLNVPYMHADYAIHNVDIHVVSPHAINEREDSSMPNIANKRILPKECWATPPMMSVQDESIPDNTDLVHPEAKAKGDQKTKNDAKEANENEESKPEEVKYRRVLRQIPELHVEDYMILPMVETTEEIKQAHDFVKIICSETVIPITEKDKAAFKDNSFVKFLPEALFTP